MKPPRRGPAVLAPAARQDIRETLQWSMEQHGVEAAKRYARLLDQALRDLEADPKRPGGRQRPELPADLYLYHLTSSRDRVAGARVKAPRHFIVYRCLPGGIEVVRILHDSRDLAQHLPRESQ